MMRATLLIPLLALAACVAPEPPRVARPVQPAVQEPRRTDLEPAPVANRGLKPPTSQSNLNVDLGPLGKPAAKPTPAAAPLGPSPDPARPAAR